jgi:hypothetical protein
MEKGASTPKTKKTKPKAQLAVVRKGCIQGQERTSAKDRKKPGRVPDPNSETTKLKALRTAKATNKLLNTLELTSCIWNESRQGGQRKENLEFTCCDGRDCYRNYRKAAGGGNELGVTISALRKYYHSLDYDNRRQWWADREHYEGYNKEGPIRRHSKLSTFFCEPYSELVHKLASTKGDELLKPVNPHTCVHVCSKFMQFICGGNHNTKDQNAVRRHAFSSPEGATPEDLDANLGSVRSHYERKTGNRSGQTAVDVRAWLHEEGQLAIVDPADNFSVLPYRTCQSTHAHYVAEREEELGVSWIKSTEERLARAWELCSKMMLSVKLRGESRREWLKRRRRAREKNRKKTEDQKTCTTNRRPVEIQR